MEAKMSTLSYPTVKGHNKIPQNAISQETRAGKSHRWRTALLDIMTAHVSTVYDNRLQYLLYDSTTVIF